MAYRSPDAHEGDRVFCHRHPADRARVACHRCLEPLCEPCSTYFEAHITCVPCKTILRRRRTVGRVLMTLAVLVLIGGGYALARYELSRFDYGTNTPLVRAAQRRVEKERCDKDATLALDQLLFDSGDYRGVLEDAGEYQKACGEWFRVHWLTYESYRRLGDDTHAVVEASTLIAHDPDDADYRWWRGIAYEALVKWPEAEADYKECIRIKPAIRSIPANLTSVLEREGKVCEAKHTLDTYIQTQLVKTGAGADDQLMARLARLTNECRE